MGEEVFTKLDLPSRLIPYRDVDCVEVRMLKGKDEKLLGDMNALNFEKRFNTLLSHGVLKGIDPTILTIGDRVYIMVWLAINCYSADYPVEIICSECFGKSTVSIELGKLDKLYLPKDYKEPHEIELLNKDIVKLRLYRVGDQIQYLDYVQDKGEDNLLYKLAQVMVDDKNMLERIKYLEELDTKSLGLMRAFQEKYVHGVSLEAAYVCPKCGGKGVTPVPFRLDMVFPAGETIAKSLGHSV